MEPLPIPPDGDVNRGYVVLVPTGITTIIGIILTGVRIYVRSSIVKKLDWDDFWQVLGMLFLIVAMGLTFGSASSGFGRHLYYLSPDQIAFSLKLARLCEFMIIFSTICIKLSICLFLMRLFVTSRRWRWFLQAFIAFNSITSIVDAAIIFPQCTPVARTWDLSVPGTCWSPDVTNISGFVQGGIATVTDVTLSILPIVFLWNIRINLKVKAGICALMALGLCSGACALARTLLVPSLKSDDPTWAIVNLFTFGLLEASVGLMAAALPAVRPLFKGTSKSSGYKTRSLPLHNTTAGHTSRRSYWSKDHPSEVLASRSSDEQYLKSDTKSNGNSGVEIIADDSGSQVKLWSQDRGHIVKTMDIEVTREIKTTDSGSSV